jgi:hypothetical protein
VRQIMPPLAGRLRGGGRGCGSTPFLKRADGESAGEANRRTASPMPDSLLDILISVSNLHMDVQREIRMYESKLNFLDSSMDV